MKKPVYQVLHIEQRPSKLNGGFYYLLKLQNIQTLDIYETSVDPAYKNFKNWAQIIKDSNRGQLITDCNLTVKRGVEIINADSRPTQSAVCDPQEMNNILEQWRAPNKFQELFE